MAGKPFQLELPLPTNQRVRYTPQPEHIKGIWESTRMYLSIKTDRLIFILAMGKIFVAKLKDNMLELDSEPREVKELPEKGLKEGPWLFERNGHVLYDLSSRRKYH